MFIRYYVVRNVVAAIAIAGVGTAWANGVFDQKSSSPFSQHAASRPVAAPPPVAPRPRPRPVQKAEPSSPPRPAALLAATTAPDESIHVAFTATAEKLMAADAGNAKKAKDALKSTGAKVNLYNDDSDAFWDRAKVDLDRDDTWDGKLTRKDGVVELETTPDHGVRVYLNGRWNPKKAATPAASPPNPVHDKPEAGDAIHAAFTTAADTLMQPGARNTKKAKDALKSTGAKVNLYNDNSDAFWDRAKVDLDRDGSWDGKLTRKNGVVELKTKPNDAVFVYRGRRWSPKK